MTTNLIGNNSEVVALTKLTQMGYTCSIPFGTACRYDLVADINGELKKIQVKSGRVRKGYLVFNAYTTCHGKDKRYELGDIDYFFVYDVENDASYLIPFAVVVALKPRLTPENEYRI